MRVIVRLPRPRLAKVTMQHLPDSDETMSKTPIHGTLSGTLTSLYAPEIHLKASFTALPPRGIRVGAWIDGAEMRVIPVSGCSLSPHDHGTLLVQSSDPTPEIELSLTEPWDYLLTDGEPPRRSWTKRLLDLTGGFWRLITSTLGNTYPFQSRLVKLAFTAPDVDLTASLRLEIPHYLTRYTSDTRNLQHIFVERGLRAPSFLEGVARGKECLQFHLHYKSLDVFRRVSAPVLTMVSVFLLDLAVLEAIPENETWSSTPLALLAFLSINGGAFGSLAAIRVGSTIRSLLNVVRFAALAWIVLLTATIRAGSMPIIGTHLETIVDWGLKASAIWLAVSGLFAFGPYALENRAYHRKHWLIAMAAFGALVGLALSFGPWRESFEVVREFFRLLESV
jgi:hypothetical protein